MNKFKRGDLIKTVVGYHGIVLSIKKREYMGRDICKVYWIENRHINSNLLSSIERVANKIK